MVLVELPDRGEGSTQGEREREKSGVTWDDAGKGWLAGWDEMARDEYRNVAWEQYKEGMCSSVGVCL